MTFETFGKEHIEAALTIARDNYLEERAFVPALPEDAKLPELDYFAENGLGITALDQGKPVGYLCWFKPWSGAFDTESDRGTFSPLHAHGAIRENRGRVYQDMYEEASRRLARSNVKGLGISLYAHDDAAKLALFEYGFGMRCKDRIRLIGDPDLSQIRNTDLTFDELPVKDFPLIRDMRMALNEHMKEAPCFMQSDESDDERWIQRVEAGDRRTFVARLNGEPVAHLDIMNDGETFVTEHPAMQSVHGSYCKPAFRGRRIFDDLLLYVMSVLKSEGCVYLGVDHESYNPAANRYWVKHFAEYTNSVTRRIELWCKDYTV